MDTADPLQHRHIIFRKGEMEKRRENKKRFVMATPDPLDNSHNLKNNRAGKSKSEKAMEQKKAKQKFYGIRLQKTPSTISVGPQILSGLRHVASL